MVQGEYANVLDYGADPTGAADSLSSFVAALAASNSVFVPAGTYKISGPLYINGTGKRFVGAGIAATVINVTGSNPGIIVGNSPSTSITNHDISVSDFSIVGGTYGLQVGSANSPLTFLGEISRIKISSASAGGLFLYQAIASFNDLAINGNYRGIVCLTAANGGGISTASMFNRCRIFNNTNEGFYCEQAWGLQFNQCNFESNGKEGVKFVKVDGTILTNITFNSCWFEANLDDGTLSSATVLVSQTGSSTPSNINFNECEFNGVTGHGSGNIHIIGPIDGISLINNRFVNPSSACIDMVAANMYGFSTQSNSAFSDSSRVNILSGELQLTAAATASVGATTNHVSLGATTSSSVGAAGGASALPATPLGYLIAYVGTTQVKIPYYTA
jgi:hypothetical protein